MVTIRLLSSRIKLDAGSFNWTTQRNCNLWSFKIRLADKYFCLWKCVHQPAICASDPTDPTESNTVICNCNETHMQTNAIRAHSMVNGIHLLSTCFKRGERVKASYRIETNYVPQICQMWSWSVVTEFNAWIKISTINIKQRWLATRSSITLTCTDWIRIAVTSP